MVGESSANYHMDKGEALAKLQEKYSWRADESDLVLVEGLPNWRRSDSLEWGWSKRLLGTKGLPDYNW